MYIDIKLFIYNLFFSFIMKNELLSLLEVGLSKDPPEPTHPLPPTEPTASAVGDGFYSPKPEINGSEIGSPPLKSEKPDPTDPSYSRRVLRFFWVGPASFEFSLGIFKLDPARFR